MSPLSNPPPTLKSHHTHTRDEGHTHPHTEDSVVVVGELGLPIKAPDMESEVADEAGEERSREVGEVGRRRQTGGVMRRGV